MDANSQEISFPSLYQPIPGLYQDLVWTRMSHDLGFVIKCPVAEKSSPTVLKLLVPYQSGGWQQMHWFSVTLPGQYVDGWTVVNRCQTALIKVTPLIGGDTLLQCCWSSALSLPTLCWSTVISKVIASRRRMVNCLSVHVWGALSRLQSSVENVEACTAGWVVFLRGKKWDTQPDKCNCLKWTPSPLAVS